MYSHGCMDALWRTKVLCIPQCPLFLIFLTLLHYLLVLTVQLAIVHLFSEKLSIPMYVNYFLNWSNSITVLPSDVCTSRVCDSQEWITVHSKVAGLIVPCLHWTLIRERKFVLLMGYPINHCPKWLKEKYNCKVISNYLQELEIK